MCDVTEIFGLLPYIVSGICVLKLFIDYPSNEPYGCLVVTCGLHPVAVVTSCARGQ